MKSAFKLFRKEDIGKLYDAFVRAFSEYYINFNPSASQFQNRIFNKLNISPNLSGLVWENKEVVGFILHTINEYQGVKTAYNGGTGVIPERRNKRLMTTLYENLLPEIVNCQAERILLEVVCENDAAIRFYESLDFHYRRTFHCYKSYETYQPRNSFRIENSPEIKEAYQSLRNFEPSFLDCSNQLQYNMQKEFILEAYTEDRLVGYIIFQPLLGRISQLAAIKAEQREEIISDLLGHAQAKSLNKKLTIMNIPEDEKDDIDCLANLGFQNEVSQYEMELIL